MIMLKMWTGRGVCAGVIMYVPRENKNRTATAHLPLVLEIKLKDVGGWSRCLAWLMAINFRVLRCSVRFI
jgi:hypothetical protein